MRNRIAYFCALVALATACTNHNVSSDEQAKEAFEGINKFIGKAITLGFDGFNTASSANISPQMTNGDSAGTVTVTGQVDQGQSANKGMRLNVAMTGYTDGKFTVDNNTLSVTYDTDSTALPTLNMMLMGIPTGTISGTLAGSFNMHGDLQGSVLLNLTFNGNLMSGPNNTVVRVPGSTTVTGTAMSNNGTFQVNVTL
jgi:hypothetical protein